MVDIDELRALLANTNLGELVACGWGDGSTQMGMTNIFDTRGETLLMECIPDEYAKLIVAAVNALPALLDELTTLRAAQQWRRRIPKYRNLLSRKGH